MAKIENVTIPEVRKIGVYAIHNKKNGKYYIGSSVNVYKRMKQQKTAIKNYGLNAKIIKDMFSKNFDVEFLVLQTFENNTITDNQLRKAEYEYIQKYDSIKNGYNTSVPFATGKYKGLLECEIIERRERAKTTATQKERVKRQNEHIKENYDRVSITLPKGTTDRIKSQGFTVNGYINKLVLQDLERLERKSNPTDDELPECFR